MTRLARLNLVVKEREIVTLDAPIREEVQAILEAHGLPCADLSVSDGFANLVVMTTDHVIRLNEGRFPDAFAHETTVLNHLPREIPHPVAVACGKRKSVGEFLIVERLAGENLDHAWPRLSVTNRGRVVRELGRILLSLHELPVAGWMRNSWVSAALMTGKWRDAYHAPPEHFPHLIASAAVERPDLRRLLHSVSDFMTARLHAFDDNEPNIFVHTDLHFRNVIVDAGHVTSLIDFEGSRFGQRDIELDMLLRSIAPDDGGAASRYPGTIATLRFAHPELFSHPSLVTRLEAYEALWHLVQLHHWRAGHTWTSDPAGPLMLLTTGAFRERVAMMLDEGIAP